jgi:hypothetical protein
MAYYDLNLGPLVVDPSTPNTPPNLVVTLLHGGDGQTRLSGRWSGGPWHTDPGQMQLRAGQQVGGPTIDVRRAYVTRRQWKMDPGSGPQGTAEFFCPESIVTFRTADPTKPGMFVLYLTGLNFLTFNLDPITFTIGTRTWTLTLFEPTFKTQETLRATEGELITATLVTELEAPVAFSEDLYNEGSEIAWLLSFGQGRGVRIARVDTWTNDGWLIEARLLSGDSHGGSHPGPVRFDDAHIGDVVGRFLTTGLPRFRQHADTYRLRVLVNFSLLARRSQPTEAIALFCANFLEILRHNYAHNVLVPSGRAMLDAHGDIRWPPSNNSGRRMYFAETIELFVKDFALSGWDARFKDLRNEVVHRGEVTGATAIERWRNTMDLLHFCDRAMLAILGIESLDTNYYKVCQNAYEKFRL